MQLLQLQLTRLVDFQSALVTIKILKHHQKNSLRQMHLVAKFNSQVQLSQTQLLQLSSGMTRRQTDTDKTLQMTARELHNAQRMQCAPFREAINQHFCNGWTLVLEETS